MISVMITLGNLNDGDLVEPPPPDFETRIDYDVWAEGSIRGRARPDDNAAEVYEEILTRAGSLDSERLEGMLGGSGAEKGNLRVPWDPDDEPGVEAVYRTTLPLLEKYKQAAQKPYFHFESMRWRAGVEPPSTQWKLIDLSAWASRVSRAAWRILHNKPDPREFVGLAGANLGLARQGERVARFPDAACASRIRRSVYNDLLAGLRHEILPQADRRRCVELLRTADTELPSLRSIAYFTLAEHYALLQARAFGDGLPLWRKKPVTWGTTTAAQLEELIKDRDEIRAALQAAAEQTTRPMTASEYPYRSPLSGLGEATDERPSVARYATLLLPMTRSFLTEIETLRRGTRLVFEVFAYRDQHGNLPESLDALADVPAWCKIDPFGGKRLVYVRGGESFRLYSVAADCVDGGGVHNSDWGRRGSGGDYVIWPPDEPKTR